MAALPSISLKNLPIPPVFSTPDTPLTSTTQDAMPIADLVDNLVLFKDGGAALVLESTSLNFGLLSEGEQEAVIVAYAALINSLSFYTQIMIRTQRKDVSKYLSYLDESIQNFKNPKLAAIAAGYKTFISETIQKKKVLEKRFYIVVPFSSVELGVTTSLKGLGRKQTALPYTKSYMLKKAKISLYPKRDHLIRQAGRLGLFLRQLENEELIRLYHTIYNPEADSVQDKDASEYESEETKDENTNNTQPTS